MRKVGMTQTNTILEHGKFNKWVGKIRRSTATALGRTGIYNKAGIDDKAYIMMLRGNLDSGSNYDNS